MKWAIALLSVLALLLIVAPAGFGVNTLAVNTSSHSSVWADGGAPIPPFPDISPSFTVGVKLGTATRPGCLVVDVI